MDRLTGGAAMIATGSRPARDQINPPPVLAPIAWLLAGSLALGFLVSRLRIS